MTGYASIGSAIEATRAGAAGYLPKPFTPEELESTIERVTIVMTKPRPGARRPAPKPLPKAEGHHRRRHAVRRAPKWRRPPRPEYVKHLTRSDVALVDFCDLGERSCKRFKTKGACEQPECPLVVAERRKKAAGGHGRAGATTSSTSTCRSASRKSRRRPPKRTPTRSAGATWPSTGRWNADKATGRKVLVVDDEVVAANSVRRTLTRRGFRVDEAFSGREALNRILNEMYDLVLLDMKMPDTQRPRTAADDQEAPPGAAGRHGHRLRLHRHGRGGHPARRHRLRGQAVHAGRAVQRRQQGDPARDGLESSAHARTRAVDQARPGRVGHGRHHGPRRQIPQRLRRSPLAARLPVRLHQARLRRHAAVARLEHRPRLPTRSGPWRPQVSLALGAFVLLLLWAASRVVSSDADPGVSFAAAAVFATSPFVVMTAHFMGYLDHLFLAAAFAAAWLARSGRLWRAAVVAACGVLVHESFVLVGLPLVLLGATVRPADDARAWRPAAWPLLALPLLAAAALWASEMFLLDRVVLRNQLVAHLSAFPFVGGDMNLFVPDWLTTGTLANWREQRHAFWRHLSDPNLLRLMVPSAALLVLAAAAVSPPGTRGRRGLAVAAAAIAPLLLHAVAWDTARIWTYTIVAGFGGVWLCSRDSRVGRRPGRRWLLAAAVPVIAANLFAQVAADGRRSGAVHRGHARPALPAVPRRRRPGLGRRLAPPEKLNWRAPPLLRGAGARMVSCGHGKGPGMAQSRREWIRGSVLASGAVLVPAGLWQQAPGVRTASGGRPRMTLRFRPYTLQLKHVFTVAVNSRTTTPVVLTEIEYDGMVGYGEASMPPYLGESHDTATAFLSKVDLGRFANPFELESILEAIDGLAPGNPAAKASVDIALHDLVGKLMKQPWYNIWGYDPKLAPVTTFTIGIDTPDVVKQKTREAAEFKVLKIKLGRDTDKAMVEAIRSVTDKPISGDANQGWTDRQQALDMIGWLKERGFLYVEQPLPKERVDDLAWLHRAQPAARHRRRGRAAAAGRAQGAGRVHGHQHQAHEVDRHARGAEDAAARPRPRHEGDARLHDRDLVRHLRGVAPVADGGLGRPRRRAPHLERPLRRREDRRRQGRASRTGRESGRSS